jgi:hypothetical protein
VLASVDIASSEHDAEKPEHLPIEGSVRGFERRNDRANHSDSLSRILVIHEESKVGQTKDRKAALEDFAEISSKPITGLQVEVSANQKLADTGGAITPDEKVSDDLIEIQDNAEAQDARNRTKSFCSPEISATAKTSQIDPDIGQVYGVCMETTSNPKAPAAPMNTDQADTVEEPEISDAQEDEPTTSDARMAEESKSFRGNPERSSPEAKVKENERLLLVVECPENVDTDRTVCDIDNAHEVQIGLNTDDDGLLSGTTSQDTRNDRQDAVNQIAQYQPNEMEDIVPSELIVAEDCDVENSSASTKVDVASQELKTSENCVALPHTYSIGAVSKHEGGDFTAVPKPLAELTNPTEEDVSGADQQLDKPFFVVDEYATINQNGSTPCLLSDEDALKSPQVAYFDSVSSESAHPSLDTIQTNEVEEERLEQSSLLTEIEADVRTPELTGVKLPGDPVVSSDFNMRIVADGDAVDCIKSSPPLFLEVDTFTPCTIASSDEVPQLNIGKLKIQLYTAAVRAYRGKGVEKLFVLYWNNLCRYVNPKQISGTRMWNVVREEINSFLTTRKLRRLHNALLLGNYIFSLQRNMS